MIKPEELRIGNYILGVWEQTVDKGNGIEADVECSEVGQFCGYYPVDDLIYMTGEYQGLHQDFEPIKITEEWLVKLGFEKSQDGMYIKYGTYQGMDKYEFFKFEYINGKLEPYRYYFAYQTTKEIKFIHELQNYYYALHGEELTIKE